MQRIVFINSHPIQYFVPLYQQMTREEKEIDLTVFYLTDETIHGYRDQQFGAEVKWDIPLLEGYRYKFFKNHSWKPSLYNGFFGLLNWGLIDELRRMPASIVISHGWAYSSNIIALLAARAFGHTVCMRGDNPLNHESYKLPLKRFLRNLFLKSIVFPSVNKFLPVGYQNRQLYRSFGIPENDLIFVPHAVDNRRFQKQARTLLSERQHLTEEIGLSGNRIILYVGKLIDKKRPLDLLMAYEQLCANHTDTALVFVGDGHLRPHIEVEVAARAIPNVVITGFVNQSQIARYYAMADVFVMCSQQGETWGLSVNEAMNFGLPIVVSNATGCADDLVVSGVNGYVFPTGNINELQQAISRCLAGQVMGQASLDRIQAYSYEAMIHGLKTISVAP